MVRRTGEKIDLPTPAALIDRRGIRVLIECSRRPSATRKDVFTGVVIVFATWAAAGHERALQSSEESRVEHAEALFEAKERGKSRSIRSAMPWSAPNFWGV